MAVYSIKKKQLTDIADAIRYKRGISDKLEVNEMPELIRSIIVNDDLPTLTDPAIPENLLDGKQLIDASGSVLDGTMTNNGAVSQVLTADNASYTVPEGYHDGTGTVRLIAETKSVTPTKDEQTIVPSSDKVLSKVTVEAIPSEYITTSDATATAGDILSGETAYVNGEKITGTMQNNGTITSTIDGIDVKSVTIPAGYTSGGTVSLDDTIDNITNDISTAIASKGVTVPSETKLDGMATLIDSIDASGIDLPELTNEGSASDLLSGKELIDSDGNIVAGTFTIDEELTTQDDLITQIQTALQNKASSSEPVLQSKTVSPSTSTQTVTPDSGYDGLSEVTVNAMPTATQATPSISVSSSGLITASATQTAGYVSAGTKSGTKQLTTQAAKTITPSTSSQTAVASGVYTTGAVTVAGDANLKAENIAEGVSIFGIAGTHSSGGGSGGDGGFEGNTDLCNVSITSDYRTEAVCYYGDCGHTVSCEYSTTYNISAICGSVIYVAQSGYYEASVSAGEIITSSGGTGFTYRVPSTPTTVTIRITTD